ncbi:MAG: leucyl/phenylalanyl-tRNA--protein transferase [Saprospiraceae bacterium]
MPVYKIQEDNIVFPHPSLANADGLLGIGGDLSPERLLLAYENGIFPWNNEGEEILWWCLTPRLILRPDKIKISKSLRQLIKNQKLKITFDQSFKEVISNCSLIQRKDQDSSWIHSDYISAFIKLFECGIAHSVEVWKSDKLCGGLYGLLIGNMFCGESMFSNESNMSKIALVQLCSKLKEKNIEIIDCQQETEHLKSLGAELMEKEAFFKFLEKNKNTPQKYQRW